MQVETLMYRDYLKREYNCSQASLCYKKHFIDDIASEYKLKMALNVRLDYS